MEYKAALEALKKLEGGADLASAIESHVTKLDEKVYTVIGESRTKGTKAQTFEATLTAIAKLLGIDGDLESALTTLETKIKSAIDDGKSAQTKLGEAETRATTAEGKIKSLERKGKITDAATKAGANAAVLERLLGDKVDELAIAEDGVKVGDKLLKEYVEGDEALKVFLPALFPTTNTTDPKGQPPAPKLPGGSPDGKPTDTATKVYAKATGRSPKQDYSWVGKR